MRRRLLLATVGLAALGLACLVAVLLLATPRHRITVENARLIQPGWTQGEVEALFGVPPGNYSEGRGVYLWDAQFGPEPKGRREQWVTDDVTVLVWFDADDGVVASQLMPRAEVRVWDIEESLFDRVRRWLGV